MIDPVMLSFDNPNTGFATIADIPAINKLLNTAYRGETSKQGWTTEADLIAGDTRADENLLLDVMNKPGSVFLIYKNEAQSVTGCVNLQKQESRIYLGMFAVSPWLQGGGIGKKLLQAAEKYAWHVKCQTIFMSVISIRIELIDWYKRHGYADTGERKPFTEDGITGKHLQPLEFMVMEKVLC